MATDLFGQKNNQYIESKNALQGQNLIYVFVEDDNDIPFWKDILDECGVKNTRVRSVNSSESGKNTLLKEVNKLGAHYIICLDSDYDYLLDGITTISELIKNNPFIFQTYTYSTENYKCFALNLYQIITDTVHCDAAEAFDCEAFMQKYSEIVYELFLYSVYYKHPIAETEVFDISDFKNIVNIANLPNDFIENSEQTLAELRVRVLEKLKTLPKIEEADLFIIKEKLQRLGLEPQNTYLFIQGHTVFTNVVLIFLKPICDYFCKQKIEQIKLHAKNPEEIKQKIQKINKNPSLETILNLNKNFKTCFLFEKIRQDFQFFVSKNHI